MLTGRRATPTTADLPNARLATIIAATIGLALAGITAIPGLPTNLNQPGSPLLQGAAIFGSFLLLTSFAVVLTKKSGRDGKAGFHKHVWLSAIGTVLVAVHSTGTLTKIPSLLLASLVVLIALGLWSRFQGARRMATTFGTKRTAFSPPDTAVRDRLAALIGKKQNLLADLAPGAEEGTFSLSPQHWRTRPFASLAYHRLVVEEMRLVGAHVGMHPGQVYWRLFHRLLAWGFMIGLMVHVLTVTFLAGYVAEGRKIYWWHVLDWGS